MPYRANLGGQFGGGAGAPASHPIDIGGAIDAFTNGASTLIQNAYVRKQGAAKLALEQQQRDTDTYRYHEQNRINEQRYQDQNTRETQRYAAEQKQKRYDAGLKALGEGVKLPDGYWDEFSAPSGAPNVPSPSAPVAPAPTGPLPPIAQSYQNNAQAPAGGPASPPQSTMPATAPGPLAGAPAAPVTSPRITVPSYSADSDPRIARSAATERAKTLAKLALAPLQTTADSTRAAHLLPVHVAQAVQTEQATAPIKIGTAVEEQRQKNALDSPAALGREAKAFVSANKPLSDAVVQYAAAKNAFAEAKAGNPAALKSAILGFASVADSKAQLRQGVIHMIEQVDPSVKGNFELALSRLTSGTLPPRILDDMEKLVERTHATHEALYTQRRAAEVGRHPALDNYLPKPDEIFKVPGISGPAGGTAPAAANPFAALIPKKP